MVLEKDLFKKILIDPANNSDELCILTGYGSAAMAEYHLTKLVELDLFPSVNLTVGMTPLSGIDSVNHECFQEYTQRESDNFGCRYIIKGDPVHSKLYIWLSGGEPREAYIGSANYSQVAFVENESNFYNQHELLVSSPPEEALTYYNRINQGSALCTSPEIESKVSIAPIGKKPGNENFLEGLPSISVPLPKKSDGKMRNKSGLNWGFRGKRNKNEAYIQLRPEVYKSDFFPPKPNRFTVYTDDGKKMIFTRAQKGREGDAIETPKGNSILGRYLRKRLGLSSGQRVKIHHLEKYGRNYIDFYKIDAETYYMDFASSDNSKTKKR
ncbi:NgoFVII family restriction endonuclease [Aliifodinibius salicampi]|uniref:NgoFVII family restriction endonuclease n=1 Tax=Fodinibius salicampi TaxID=1920655 RepID=A0ABT3PXV5_9BACT|nr:restriction endonuclease PLD domain-containing protein [Fodinibius salicampi]MCW9712674.1 NgoFVII family restriction endonuclease [Fodinibius salicampi]